MKRRGRAPDDQVTPELRDYVLARDRRCVIALLDQTGRLSRDPGVCRDRFGRKYVGFDSDLTIAHVRDRAGGRAGKRPPSTARRLIAVCAGHHLLDSIVDRADVRPVIEEYLDELEGPDLDESRPAETVRRIRARGVRSSTSEGKVDG